MNNGKSGISIVSAKVTLLSTCVLLGATACSTTPEPVSDNRPGTLKKESAEQVQVGLVTAVKKVTVLAKRSGLGNTAGRAVGSIAGGTLGAGYGSVAGSVFGGMIGGVLGSKADDNLQKQPGLEITVRLDDGQHVTITQLAKDEEFKSGDRVQLVMKDGEAQVRHQS